MLRIATIGTSMITDDFIQVVNANDQAAFVGTLSRDADRGAAFTAKYGGERNFTALDELASAADVDAGFETCRRIDVRGRRVAAEVVKLPFYKREK